jgi:hypothetical protein
LWTTAETTEPTIPVDGAIGTVGRRKRLPHKDGSPSTARWDRRFRLSSRRSARLLRGSSAWRSIPAPAQSCRRCCAPRFRGLPPRRPPG